MLERLETYNFKSYKGRQIIGPFKSFTCTIGPNGAGKSNVMDAISFVLGVRSAQLRSNQLRDLIYRAGARHDGNQNDGEGEGADEEMGDGENGNGNGHGHGAEDARDAWVLAVYVDAEEREWQFRRSITLAGHSEYRINGETTTAGKYNKVLESHGILVKAKNFLVFQGDVEAVASQSPKDLTKLIEQISGSADLKDEYDRAKAVQDKAVETSTHNYVKRRGVNAEVKQFKEQKSEAEKFEQLRADRDEAVVRHLLWKLYHINSEISTATEEIDALSESLAGLRAEQTKHEASLKSARKEVASAQKAALKQEKEVKKREKDLEEKKPELAEIDEKIKHVKRKIAKAQETAATVEREKKDKQGKVASLQSELARFEAVFAQQKEDQRKTLASKGMTLSEDDLKEYNVLKAESAKKAVKERQELETLERELKTKRSEMASVQDRLQQARNTQQRLADEDATYSERRTRMDARVAALSQDLARVKRELQDMQTERTRFNQQQTELDEKLQDVYRKLQQAEADRKESNKEVRFKELLEDLKRSFGSDAVKGRVSDLCKPSSRKYDTAVSITLGRNIDSIVVDTHATGVQCMNYLRENRKGTATFLPLDTLTPKPVNDKFRNYARGARLALDIIEYDAMYERAMLHACANTLICDSMEIAKHVSYEKGQEVKAVTLDGSMIHKSGLMTGGFDARGTGGRCWDEQEVTNLNRQREQYQNRMKELQSKRPREQHDDRLVAEINKLESSLTSDKEDLAVTKNKLKDITENLKHVDKHIKELSAQVEKGTAGIEERSGRLNQLKTVVARAEDEVFASFCQRIGVRNIREYESKQLKDAQAHGEANLKLETTIARVKNQRAFESEQLESISDRLQILTKSITSEQGKLADLEGAKAEAETALKELSARIDEVRTTCSAAQKVLEARTAELEQVKKGAAKSGRGFDRAFKEIASWNDTIEKLASERFAIYRRCKLEEIDLPLTKGRLDKIPVEEKLRDSMAMDVDDENDEESAVEGTQTARKVDDYGIELDFGSLTEDETENASDAAEKELLDRIVELQGEIDRMSPNMKAIDRLDEVEAKLAGISKEFEDARKTAKDAKDAFNDVKDRRCALFNKAYDHISERIDSVYKDLTKGKAAPMGGVAYLSLEDNDEPYLHGIKYHAMPPMKRFRDMDQLSGGEKTMAALALLFAIHSYKPSPFFVLDEVDASLDNSNVSKIAEYVRSRANKDFQFIVISLKNTFWERAQGLVGIYRDVEARSSKVLTLDLELYAET